METGHNKNVANFEAVTIILNSLGVTYNPSQALIQIPALQTRLAEARAALAASDAADADKAVRIDEREAEFRDLGKFAVNIKRAAAVEVNDEAFTRDLQSIVNRFHSNTRTPAPSAATPEDEENQPGRRSTSQRSFDDQIAHLADILALLRTKADVYRPNDPEYKIPAIEAKIDALETKNNAARNASIVAGLAKDARDEVLYNNETGVYKLVKLIKTRLALKPGKTSAAYKQVNALEFRRVK